MRILRLRLCVEVEQRWLQVFVVLVVFVLVKLELMVPRATIEAELHAKMLFRSISQVSYMFGHDLHLDSWHKHEIEKI